MKVQADPVDAVRFRKAGDHPAVVSRWALPESHPDKGIVYWFFEYDERGHALYDKPVTKDTMLAVEYHVLETKDGFWRGEVKVGDWIVTDHKGRHRVMPDEEFREEYPNIVLDCGFTMPTYDPGPSLDWSDTYE